MEQEWPGVRAAMPWLIAAGLCVLVAASAIAFFPASDRSIGGSSAIPRSDLATPIGDPETIEALQAEIDSLETLLAMAGEAGLPGELAFGVTLGEFGSVAAARARWDELSASQPTALAGLTPLVQAYDGAEGLVVVLVAGPFADAVTPAERCDGLTASGISCGQALYEGQPLGG